VTARPERIPELRPGTIIAIGLWFGLVTGLVEALILTFRAYGLGQLIHVSWHFPWMAPVANGLFFLIPALLLALASRVVPRLVSFRLVAFIFSMLSLAALFLLYPKIFPYASVLLAAGIAFQLSRILTRHRAGTQQLVKRTMGTLVVLIVLLAGGMIGYQAIKERKTLVALPAAPAGAPNVLLIILDTVRAANLSLYGYQRETTPNLERLALGGVRFDHAFSTAPWTLPSHASLVTGRWPHELSADWIAPLDKARPTLAEYFTNRGYTTGAFMANVGYCSWEFGLARGFAHYRDFPIGLASIVSSTSIGRQIDRSFLLRNLVRSDQHLVRVHAPVINGGFLGWVDGRGNRPFFAMLNYYDAHGPYLPPPPYDKKFSATGRSGNLSPLHRYLARPRRTLPAPEIVQREIDQYDGALAYLDQELGKLFAALKERGLLDNTIILVTADHGEEFGEHGIFDHGNSLYRPSVEVPLFIVAAERAPSGRVIDAPVSLRDVARTLSQLAGDDRAVPFPGSSLARFWTEPTAGPDPVLAEVSKGLRTPGWYPVSRGDMRSVVADSFRLIRNGDGSEELYRVVEDPWEKKNLMASDSTKPGVERLRVLMTAQGRQ
jgi:arylsulfatase A-like enzyme